MRGTIRTVAALLLLAPAARANPADTYGYFAKGLATAGAQTASADDAEATYYNPAGLALRGPKTRTSVQLGYAAGAPFAGLTHAADARPTIAARLPEYEGWITLGGRIPFRGLLDKRAVLGFAVYMPQDKIVRVESLDPKTPQWLRYQSSAQRIALTASLGARLGDWAAVGAGANVLAMLAGRVLFDVDLFAKTVKTREMTFDLKTVVAPTAGLVLTPPIPLRFALAWRGPIRLDVVQPSTLGLGDVGTLVLDVTATMHYTPHQVSAGMSWEAAEGLRFCVDALYSAWHLAPNPATSLQVDLKGEIPEGLNLDEAVAMKTKDKSPRFEDTVATSVGAEITMPDGVTVLRAGVGYRPTFVPDQTGATNWLDNSAMLLGAGVSFQFHDPTGVFPAPLHLDLGAQLQSFFPREVKKDQINDPVGGYRFGGTALAAAAALRYELWE